MFFRKNKAEWNVLNDKDNNIVNLYMCVIEKTDELVDNLNWIPKSRKLFLDFKEEVQEKQEIDIPDPMRAAKYFYCIRHSFNKLIHTPLSMVKDWNKNWEEEFKYSREKIGGSTIENLDFAELVDRYYQHNFNADDHLRLKEKVDKIHEQGGKFMISYDHEERVAELYKDYDVRTINLKYAGATDEAKQKERKEYLIINYEPANQVGLFEQ